MEKHANITVGSNYRRIQHTLGDQQRSEQYLPSSWKQNAFRTEEFLVKWQNTKHRWAFHHTAKWDKIPRVHAELTTLSLASFEAARLRASWEGGLRGFTPSPLPDFRHMENSESQDLTEARQRASSPSESRDRQSVTREWQASVGRGAWSGLGNPFEARFARAWLVHVTRRRKRGGERKESTYAPQYFHTSHTRTCSLRYLQLRPSSSSLPKNGRSEIESFSMTTRVL